MAFVLALLLSCYFFASLKLGFASYRVMHSLFGEMAISVGLLYLPQNLLQHTKP